MAEVVNWVPPMATTLFPPGSIERTRFVGTVLVPIDGVASRRDDHRAAGIELCRAAGATITTMETIVFDWLRRAGTETFKHLSKRIR